MESLKKQSSRPVKTRTITVRLDDTLADKADAIAESRGWSLSAVLRALVELWVEEDILEAPTVGKAARRAPRTKKGMGGVR